MSEESVELSSEESKQHSEAINSFFTNTPVFHHDECQQKYVELESQLAQEKAAREKSEDLAEKYRKALEWYSDHANYSSYETASCGCCSNTKTPAVEDDQGHRAREALKGDSHGKV